MENKTENTNQAPNNEGRDDSRNANSAYSGSGTWQPGGATGEAGKLSDTGTDDEATLQTDSIPGNQTDQPFTAESAPEHGTDPSKLPDL